MVRTNGVDEADSVPFNNVPPNAPPLIVGADVWTANFEVVVTVTPPSLAPVAVNVVPPSFELQVTKNPVVVFVVATDTDVTLLPPEEAANVHDAPVAVKSKVRANPDGA